MSAPSNSITKRDSPQCQPVWEDCETKESEHPAAKEIFVHTGKEKAVTERFPRCDQEA